MQDQSRQGIFYRHGNKLLPVFQGAYLPERLVKDINLIGRDCGRSYAHEYIQAGKMDTLNELPAYTMIVSEGIKTEPLFTRDSGRQGRKERSSEEGRLCHGDIEKYPDFSP